MRFISTRGNAPTLGFKDAILAGLANDGGLYVPEVWPVVTPAEIAGFRGKPYAEVAFTVLSKFIGREIEDAALREIVADAYSTFHHTATVPLVQVGPNDWLLELFHGPTLAFKDVAMQLLARMVDHVLAERGERLTIVGATSGDTGGAALQAFKGRTNIDVFFMFPQGRVSDFQRRQMTTIDAANGHAIAIAGSFDDCQRMVKAMFANTAFRDRVRLSAVNSINWGRIMAQAVYYFTAAAALGAPDRAVGFAVPTGNFGDVYAGYVAKRLGLPVTKLLVATNANDILVRTLATGDHRLARVKHTITPSMDIQISSNFERLLFEASGRNGPLVHALMHDLGRSGGYTVPETILQEIAGVVLAGTASEKETLAEMTRTHAETGYLCDPHTAVAKHVARELGDPAAPVIVLATAHPAKFPDAVRRATGISPCPPTWAEIPDDRAENLTRLENDQRMVEQFIVSRLSQ